MNPLRTAFTDRFDLHYPIVNAPMTPQAGGALARAVSACGALGMLGFDEDESVESLRAQVALARAEPARPFGIGLVRWVIDARPEVVDLAIASHPTVVSISFGDPAPFVPRFHAAGIAVIAQVQSRSTAAAALAADVDVLVAQGTEGGGHTGTIATLPLLQIVLDMAAGTPVLAAGGVATGRGLAAVLAAGASGAWIGTPFLTSNEARTNDAARARLIASAETDTILTSAFDRVQGKPWPDEIPGRALRNAFTDAWHDRPREITPEARDAFNAAKAARDYNVANIYAGQSAGLVERSAPAADIVTSIAGLADELLSAIAAR